MPSRPETLAVGGFTPFSASDWPGCLAAVVFVQGCPWRCSYCHNAALQPRAAAPAGPQWTELRARLGARAGLLDGVVFSGGEPTLDPALPAALGEVRAMGLRTGLHTTGLSPRRLAAVLPLLDWVGLDVKAPPAAMDRLTGVRRSHRGMQSALQQVLQGARSHELRTTWHPDWLDEAELLELADWLAAQGVERWTLQAGRSSARGGASTAVPPPALLHALRQRVPRCKSA